MEAGGTSDGTLSPQEGPAASAWTREARPAVSAGSLLLPRAAGPQKLPDSGFCRTAVAYGLGKRHKHSSIFFILQKLLSPQLLPSSSKALEPVTLVYRCWLRRPCCPMDPALLGSCQKRISEDTRMLPAPGTFSNLS